MSTPGVVLVTGARGFVAPHLIALLRSRGARVSGLGPEPDAGVLPLERWHQADLRVADQLRAAIGAIRPDTIVHLAAQSSAAVSFVDPSGTLEINTLGTLRLLEAMCAEAPRARLLLVGSGEVYGTQAAGTRAAEDAPLRPVSPYALSKAAAEAVADIMARRHGLDIVRVRAFGHAGPGQTPRFVLPAFARQIAAIEAGRGEPVLKVGNLDVVRDLTDVRDVVAAYVALLERGESGATYNVCRGEGTRLSDLARDLLRRSRVPIRIEVEPARMRPSEVPFLVGDPSLLKRHTGWRDEIPLERTLDDVLAEWRRAEGSADGSA